MESPHIPPSRGARSEPQWNNELQQRHEAGPPWAQPAFPSSVCVVDPKLLNKSVCPSYDYSIKLQFRGVPYPLFWREKHILFPLILILGQWLVVDQFDSIPFFPQNQWFNEPIHLANSLWSAGVEPAKISGGSTPWFVEDYFNLSCHRVSRDRRTLWYAYVFLMALTSFFVHRTWVVLPNR